MTPRATLHPCSRLPNHPTRPTPTPWLPKPTSGPSAPRQLQPAATCSHIAGHGSPHPFPPSAAPPLCPHIPPRARPIPGPPPGPVPAQPLPDPRLKPNPVPGPAPPHPKQKGGNQYWKRAKVVGNGEQGSRSYSPPPIISIPIHTSHNQTPRPHITPSFLIYPPPHAGIIFELLQFYFFSFSALFLLLFRSICRGFSPADQTR